MCYFCKFFTGLSLSFVLSSAVMAQTSFVVVGHLYPIIKDKVLLEKMFNKFEQLDPDYIFVLGDSSLQEKEVYLDFYSRFEKKIYFSPGNNELVDGALNKFQENVGYLNKIVESDDTRFILLNSLGDVEGIKRFLKYAIKENTQKSQILLTHHRIWDDTLLSEHPYQHDKSYYFKELYPLLKEKINAIFSGNSKRQYFSDYRVMSAKQNVNNIYWVDQIGEIDCYSVGSGDGKPKLGFVYVKNLDGDLMVKPYNVNSEGLEPIPINKIRLALGSFDPTNPKKDKNNSWLYKFYLNMIDFIYSAPRVKLLLLSFGIGCMVGFYIFRRMKK